MRDIGASDRLAEEQRCGVSRFPVAQGALRSCGLGLRLDGRITAVERINDP